MGVPSKSALASAFSGAAPLETEPGSVTVGYPAVAASSLSACCAAGEWSAAA